MQNKASELETKKSRSKLSKSKKILHVDQAISPEKEFCRQKMIAIAAYYRAEKRGFKSNEADTVQDWLEAEMEIDNV
jgi:hypothetical protein